MSRKTEVTLSKIQENKDYTIERGRKMNEMLDNFQQKF